MNSNDFMKLTNCFIIALLCCSCNIFSDKPKTPSDSTTIIRDTLVLTRDSLVRVAVGDTSVIGFYQGMLPCKGCDGIQQTILFTMDSMYKLEEKNWGKNQVSKKQQGKWAKKENTIFMYLNDKVVARYKLKSDSLIITDQNGSYFSDSVSRQYVLFKRPTAGNNSTWMKKKQEGIDIAGVGNEPFWSLEIDNDKMVLFKVADWSKPVIVPIEKPVVTKDSIYYSIPAQGTMLNITILPEFCNDGMSNFLYEYQIRVTYNGQLYKGCGIFLNKP